MLKESIMTKRTQIIKINDLNSLSVVHMTVPCCTGLTNIAKRAVLAGGKQMIFNDITIDLNGKVLESNRIDMPMEIV